MEALIVIVSIFGLLWVLVLLPQQRRVRAHQQLVMSLEEGDEVILTAGIFGRITVLGPEELDLEVAPGVELRVARQAVLRRVEHAIDSNRVAEDADAEIVDGDDFDAPTDEITEEAGETVDEAAAAEPARIDSDAVGDNNADRPDGDRTTS